MISLELAQGSSMLDPIFLERNHLDCLSAIGERNEDFTFAGLHDAGIGILFPSGLLRFLLCQAESGAADFNVTHIRPGLAVVFGERNRKRLAHAIATAGAYAGIIERHH